MAGDTVSSPGPGQSPSSALSPAARSGVPWETAGGDLGSLVPVPYMGGQVGFWPLALACRALAVGVFEE